jgi:hypothetical protein
MLDLLGRDLLDYLIGFAVDHLDDDLIDLLIDGELDPMVEGEEGFFKGSELGFDFSPVDGLDGLPGDLGPIGDRLLFLQRDLRKGFDASIEGISRPMALPPGRAAWAHPAPRRLFPCARISRP